MPIPGRYVTDPGTRLWPRLQAARNGCREWTGSRNDHGYGQLRVDNRLVKAHRFAWTLTYGPLPPGVDALHRCDNPPCCEPTHLFLGGAADNGQDMAQKGRHGAWTSPHRVARGERHGCAKLTDGAVRAIRRLLGKGASISAIARQFQVSRQTVRKVRDGQTWRHLT